MKRAWFYLGTAALLQTAAACSFIASVDRVEPGGSGGSGGAGGTGGGDGTGGGAGGTGGAGGGEPEGTAWEAGAPDPNTGAYELPSWLVFESPSENKTVQTGPDRVRTGFGANAPRARSVDATTWGLAVEGERTNRINSARVAAPGWEAISGTLTAAPGPDGEELAGLVEDTSNTQSAAAIEQFTAAPGEDVTISAWVMTGDSQATLECNSCQAPQSVVIDPMLAWHRESLTTTEAPGGTPLVRLRPAGPMANLEGSASFDFVNLETGRYPSSAILTTTSGTPETRQAEKLYAPAASDLAPGGFFNVTLRIAPHYASGEQAVDHDILFFDVQNRLYVRAADSAVVLQAEGMDVAETEPLTWARDEELTIEVTNTESGRTLRVVAGANESAAESMDPGSFPVTGAIHLLGSDTGAQEGADLRAITFKPLM